MTEPTAESLREALRAVIDPELGINIVDLGLVYGIDLGADAVRVRLTMTSAACPLGEMIADEVAATLAAQLPAGPPPQVELVWSPPWTPEMMSERARRTLAC